jgi:hypothetical protein
LRTVDLQACGRKADLAIPIRDVPGGPSGCTVIVARLPLYRIEIEMLLLQAMPVASQRIPCGIA